MMMLTRLLSGFPLYVVWIGGIVFAIVRWSRYPRVCALVAAACALEIVSTLGSTIVYSLMPMLMDRGGMSMSAMSSIYSAYGFFQGLMSAVAWGLMLFAMFGWRDNPQAA